MIIFFSDVRIAVLYGSTSYEVLYTATYSTLPTSMSGMVFGYLYFKTKNCKIASKNLVRWTEITQLIIIVKIFLKTLAFNVWCHKTNVLNISLVSYLHFIFNLVLFRCFLYTITLFSIKKKKPKNYVSIV